MYHIELIKGQSPTGIKNKVQTWIDEQYHKNQRFNLISASFTYESNEGYRAFITYTN